MKKIIIAFGILLSSINVWGIFPMKLVNNSSFQDSEVYVAIIGNSAGHYYYYDLTNNKANNVSMPELTAEKNTLHKKSGDWGYADVFVTLDKLQDKTIYIDRSMACRMFFGFKSPMWLHVRETGGYAGADLNNPDDPNRDLRWEVIEFSYNNDDVMFVNTTRVDAFQYPMAIDLYGDVAAGANNAHMSRGEVCSYKEVISKWEEAYNGTTFGKCKISGRITKDNLGPIIVQPSKVDDVKNSGTFDAYINKIWSTFETKTLRANMGERGVWYGKVEGGEFVMHQVGGSAVGRVGKPTTTDVIEGAGTFATGGEMDKAVQAQFCGAMNRGMIDCDVADNVEQKWGDVSKFFTKNTWNEYVKFFHREDISVGKYTYAFAYDDTFDQSSTCATSHPKSLTVTIGGYKGADENEGQGSNEDERPGGNEGDNENENEGEGENPVGGESGSGKTDKGLEYSYRFTQTGMNVTVKYTCTNASSFTGLVPVLWDNTNGFREIMNVDSYTFENCTVGQVLKVACKWMFAGGDTVTPYAEYVVKNLTSTEITELITHSAYKMIRDGRLYIVRDGKMYDVLGR